MTEENYEKATEIMYRIKAIKKARFEIFSYPYPSFYYDDEEVSFARFDEDTRTELKEAIIDILDKRREVLEKELEDL